jgi:thymidylate synthase ThyX
MLFTRQLKVKFLGITPVLKDETGVLNPQEIVALSALLTFKGKSIKNLLKDLLEKGGSLKERISSILQKSSLRGHASVATTPSLCLTYEGSKFLDSALTGIYFSSSLVSSGRRTETTEKDIVFPDKISSNQKARKIYKDTSERIIKFFNFLLAQKIQKDEASKILQYGIYGTGVIQLPIETIIGLKREYQREKEWMPEELGILLKKIEKEAKNLGIDWLYSTREAAPRNVYPYPNIFKNPKESNLVRELRKKIKLREGSELISVELLITPELKRKLIDLGKKTENTFSSLTKIKKDWQKLLDLRQTIFRDYNSVLRIKVLSTIPWRVWGEKKRHRTCPQIIESIYYCVERAAEIFQKNKKLIKKFDERPFISPLRFAREIEEVFSIPPSIKKNQAFLNEYLLTALKSFDSYRKLINLGIKPREAIFLIPRGVKIDILQEYDLYNLLTGYYPLRLCQTAEEEMRRNTLRETVQIKKSLAEKGYNWLNKFIVPKCQIMGFCPEEKSCPMILSAVKNYNEKFHQEMKEELKKKFEENLKFLGRR